MNAATNRPPTPDPSLRAAAALAAIIGAATATASAQPGDPSTAAPPPDRFASAHLLALHAAPADAPTDAPPHAAPHEAGPFHVSVATYFWLTSLSGDLGVRGVQFDADISFSDIVDDADTLFALSGAVDIEYKRWVFQVNGIWSTVGLSERRRTQFQNVEVSGDLETDMAWFEGFAGYRFIETPLGKSPDTKASLGIDGFLGLRFTAISVDLDARAEAMVTLPGGEVLEAGVRRELDQTEAWFEPFVGARAAVQLDEHWSFSLRGDVGGFGLGNSEFSWQAAALFGYEWLLDGWNFGLFGGYRAISQDYEDGGFKWDVITHGPLFGLRAAFAF